MEYDDLSWSEEEMSGTREEKLEAYRDLFFAIRSIDRYRQIFNTYDFPGEPAFRPCLSGRYNLHTGKITIFIKLAVASTCERTKHKFGSIVHSTLDEWQLDPRETKPIFNMLCDRSRELLARDLVHNIHNDLLHSIEETGDYNKIDTFRRALKSLYMRLTDAA